MPIPELDHLLKLDIATRLTLVQLLWDSILADAATLPLRSSERELLDARVKEDDDTPDAAIPWAEARAALLGER